MHLKVNKKKGIRSKSEPGKEEKELEGLLSTQEWFQVYVKTVSGLWQLGPTYYHRMVYLIYCATLSAKFSKEVEKVSLLHTGIFWVKFLRSHFSGSD